MCWDLAANQSFELEKIAKKVKSILKIRFRLFVWIEIVFVFVSGILYLTVVATMSYFLGRHGGQDVVNNSHQLSINSSLTLNTTEQSIGASFILNKSIIH